MSGRGGSGGRGGGRGGRGRGRGSTGTALMGREMLKRSATEAGLLGKGKIGDPGNAFFADIMRPSGPLYGPFLWHSSGNVRQDDSTNDANTVGVGGSVGGAGLMTSSSSSATPDAAMSNTSAVAAAAASAAKGNRKTPPIIAVTKRTPSMTFLVSRQRELMERFQASTHHVRIHPQIDVARYNSSNNNNNNNNATPPDVAIREESMSKKLAKDERYIPVEILYPSAASLAMSRSSMIEANKKRKRQQELDELEKQELGGSGFGGANNEEEEDDDDDNDEFEEPPEEQEEGEDYTTNYYDTEDDSAGGDGNEATF